MATFFLVYSNKKEGKEMPPRKLMPQALGNCSMRRLKRLLLMHYLLHPCSRKGLPSVALSVFGRRSGTHDDEAVT